MICNLCLAYVTRPLSFARKSSAHSVKTNLRTQEVLCRLDQGFGIFICCFSTNITVASSIDLQVFYCKHLLLFVVYGVGTSHYMHMYYCLLSSSLFISNQLINYIFYEIYGHVMFYILMHSA